MHTLRALKAIVHDAVDATVELVREGNESAARQVRSATSQMQGVGAAVRGVDDVRRVTTAGVLGSVKAINRVVEFVSDSTLDALHVGDTTASHQPVRLSADVAGERAWLGDAALGVLNAVVGDYLEASDNTLALEMSLRVGDVYLDASSSTQRWEESVATLSSHLCVFVHGLGATEWSWSLGSTAYYGSPEVNLSTQVAQALGASVVYVRYNTGRSLQDNGEQLAQMLERLCEEMGIERLTLVGHSMGGLVLRHACHHAQEMGLGWGEHVRDVAYLGSPHEGAPLAAFGRALTTRLGSIDLPATRIIAQILDVRSTGTKDLAEGMSSAMREQLPLSCTHHFVLGTIMEDTSSTASRFIGDLLVRPSSASNSATKTSHLDRSVSHHGGLLHHHLQNHPVVSNALLASLEHTI